MRARVLELCIKHMMYCWINTVLGKLANVPLRRCWVRGDDHRVGIRVWSYFVVRSSMKLCDG